MTDQRPGEDPDKRAFTGHPDHPPSESDQPAEQNEELLRPDGQKGENGGESAPEGGGTGGDEQWTSLPGYG